MPTMMSARSSLAISSRIAGVSAVGTTAPYHGCRDWTTLGALAPPRPQANGVGGAPPWTSVGRPEVSSRGREAGSGSTRGSAGGQVGDGPVRVLLARQVARVRGLVRHAAEAERAPRAEPCVDWRTDE